MYLVEQWRACWECAINVKGLCIRQESEVFFSGKDHDLVIVNQEEVFPTSSVWESGREADISSEGRKDGSVFVSSSVQRGPDRLKARQLCQHISRVLFLANYVQLIIVGHEVLSSLALFLKPSEVALWFLHLQNWKSVPSLIFVNIPLKLKVSSVCLDELRLSHHVANYRIISVSEDLFQFSCLSLGYFRNLSWAGITKFISNVYQNGVTQ